MSRNIQGTQREVRKVEKMVRRMYRIIKDEKEKEENRAILEKKIKENHNKKEASAGYVDRKMESCKSWTKLYVDKKCKKLTTLTMASVAVMIIFWNFALHHIRR